MSCTGPFQNCNRVLHNGTPAAMATLAVQPPPPVMPGDDGRITSITRDRMGIMRCGVCKRFANPQKRPHICPTTASGEKLNRALARRLKIPRNAYGAQALDVLLKAAGMGDVVMRHPFTGEAARVGLDGLALALSGGYSPDVWSGLKQTTVDLGDGRTLSVLDPTGMTPASPPDNGIAAAAAAYGVVAPDNLDQVGSAAGLPVTPAVQVQPAAVTEVTGGTAYDLGHFIGTEYRKKSGLGQTVTVGDKSYVVGQSSQDTEDYSSARIKGHAAMPKGGVKVGRTLVSAVGLLAEGAITEARPGVMEVYDANGELVSVYDHNTRTAGDMEGTPNASAEQMAAVVAYHLKHPDPHDPVSQALVSDFAGMSGSDPDSRSPLGVADSAYLQIKGMLEHGNELNLGGTVSAQRCPDCGRWTGSGYHDCPKKPPASAATAPAEGATPPAPASATPAPAPPVGVPVPTSVSVVVEQVQAQMDAQVLADGVARGLREAPPQQVEVSVKAELEGKPEPLTLDAEALTKGLAESLQSLQESLTGRDAELAQAIKDGMAGVAENLSRALQDTVGAAAVSRQRESVPSDSVPPVWMEQLLERLAQPAVPDTPRPAPSPEEKEPRRSKRREQPVAATKPVPRAANPLPADVAAMTGQEYIFNAVEFPAPDTTLSAVPAHVGGSLTQPLEERIPPVNPNYEINEQTEGVLRMMSAMLQQGMSDPANPNTGWTKAFLLYGPAGSGKDTAAEQLAASLKTRHPDGTVTQGVNFWAQTFEPNTSMDALLGSAVLEPDPETGATRSRLQLGPLAQAAAMGSVVCLDEVVNLDPKSLSVLQDMVEKRTVTISSPEGGMVSIPVHPSTVFVCTMNPGYEGGRDRPGLALLSRLTSFRMDGPSRDEAARRIEAFFAGQTEGAAATKGIEQRRQEILANEYKFSPVDFSQRTELAMAAATLNDDVARLARREGGIGGQIGLNSDTPPEASIRMAYRFAALSDAVGPWEASRIYDILCDQDDTFADQRRLIDERVEAVFGPPGAPIDAVRAREQGRGPARV